MPFLNLGASKEVVTYRGRQGVHALNAGSGKLRESRGVGANFPRGGGHNLGNPKAKTHCPAPVPCSCCSGAVRNTLQGRHPETLPPPTVGRGGEGGSTRGRVGAAWAWRSGEPGGVTEAQLSGLPSQPRAMSSQRRVQWHETSQGLEKRQRRRGRQLRRG